TAPGVCNSTIPKIPNISPSTNITGLRMVSSYRPLLETSVDLNLQRPCRNPHRTITLHPIHPSRIRVDSFHETRFSVGPLRGHFHDPALGKGLGKLSAHVGRDGSTGEGTAGISGSGIRQGH